MKRNVSLIAILFIFVTCSFYLHTPVSESSAMSYFDANKSQLDIIEGVWVSQQYLVKYVNKQYASTQEIEGKEKRIIMKENGVFTSYTPDGESTVYFTKTDEEGLYFRNVPGDDARMDEAYIADDGSLEVMTLLPADIDMSSSNAVEENSDLDKIQLSSPTSKTDLYRVTKYTKIYPAE